MNLDRRERTSLVTVSRPARQRSRARPSRAGLSVVAGGRTSTMVQTRSRVRLSNFVVTRPSERHAPAAQASLGRRLGTLLQQHRGWIPAPLLTVALAAPSRAAPMHWLVGLLLVGVGTLLGLAGSAVVGADAARRPAPRLVTFGAYAWVRHPRYLGRGLAWTGFALLAGATWLVPAVLVTFALAYGLIVRQEEAELEAACGEEFLRYRRRVSRWIPRKPVVALAGEHDWVRAWRAECATLLGYTALVGAFAAKLLVA